MNGQFCVCGFDQQMKDIIRLYLTPTSKHALSKYLLEDRGDTIITRNGPEADETLVVSSTFNFSLYAAQIAPLILKWKNAEKQIDAYSTPVNSLLPEPEGEAHLV